MKLACASPLLPGENWRKKVQNLAEWGYEGISVFVTPDEWSVSSADEVEEACKKFGIRVCEFAYIGDGVGHLNDSQITLREKNVELVRQAIRESRRFGAITEIEYECTMVRPMPSHDYNDYQDLPDEDFKRFAALYRLLLAEDKQVPVLLETLNRYESRYFNLQEQGRKLIDEVDLPNAGLLCDLFHMGLDEYDLYESLRKNGPRIKHVHLSDTNRRTPGKGFFHFEDICRVFREVDYNGFFSLECTLQPNREKDLRETAAYLKQCWEKA